MTEGSPEEREKTVREIMDDADRAESRRPNGLWTLALLFAMLAAAGWLVFGLLRSR